MEKLRLPATASAAQAHIFKQVAPVSCAIADTGTQRNAQPSLLLAVANLAQYPGAMGSRRILRAYDSEVTGRLGRRPRCRFRPCAAACSMAAQLASEPWTPAGRSLHQRPTDALATGTKELPSLELVTSHRNFLPAQNIAELAVCQGDDVAERRAQTAIGKTERQLRITPVPVRCVQRCRALVRGGELVAKVSWMRQPGLDAGRAPVGRPRRQAVLQPNHEQRVGTHTTQGWPVGRCRRRIVRLSCRPSSRMS